MTVAVAATASAAAAAATAAAATVMAAAERALAQIFRLTRDAINDGVRKLGPFRLRNRKMAQSHRSK